MVKDEEQNIERCLKSIQNIRDQINTELIIVDTGSKDRTVEIVQKYTTKVYYHPWNNDFSEMRNITISYATGEWLFILDADEEIVDDSGIIAFFKQDKKFHNFNTLCIALRNFNFKNDNKTFSDQNAVRFFRNDGEFHFESIIHNIPIFKEPVGSLDGRMNHYGYINDDPILMDKKFSRTSEMLKQALKIDPKNVYYRYQLSVSYCMHNEWENGDIEAKIAYELIEHESDLVKDKHFYVYGLLMQIAKSNDRHYQTIQIAEEALRIRKEDIDSHFYLADAYLCLDRQKEAIDGLVNYLELVSKYERREMFINLDIKLETIKFKSKALNNLLYVLFMNEYYKEVLDYYRKYVDFHLKDQADRMMIEIVIKAAIKEGRYAYVYELYQRDEIEYKRMIQKELEKQMVYLDKSERQNFSSLFRSNQNSYGILHRLRYNIKKEQKDPALLEKRISLVEAEKELEYADVIFDYYYKSNRVDIFIDWITSDKLLCSLETIDHLVHLSDSFQEWAHEYLKQDTPNKVELLQFWNILQKYFLLQYDFNQKSNEGVPLFNRYVSDVYRRLSMTYRKDFLDNESQWTAIEDKEERMCLFMKRAIEIDVFESVQYLKKALPLSEELKNYIHQIIFAKEAEIKLAEG